MKMFWKFAPWLTRLILLPPTFIFALIASRYIAHPVQAAATVGITLDKPLATTILRIGFGAFPLGCSIFTLSCLVSTRRLLTGLSFVITMMSVALVVRVFGMLVDGTVRESMGLVSAEAVMLVLFIVGAFIERGRRKQIRQAARRVCNLSSFTWSEKMRSKVLLTAIAAGLIVMAAPGAARAQSQDETPRFEAGVQFVGLRLNGTGEGAAGIGGRFGFNLTNYVSLEAETNYFPKNPSGNYGETLGLFGVKITKRFDRFGVFAKVRPGFVHFSGDLASRLSRKDQFALDAGGGFEFYANRHTALRFDIGDTIIPYGNTTILLGRSPTTLGTKNNLQFEVGFAVRF